MIKVNHAYLAFLFGDLAALPFIDHRALLLGNVLADLVLDGVALPLVDDLALGHGVGGALLLGHGLALLLVPGGAGLGSGTRFLVEGFMDRFLGDLTSLLGVGTGLVRNISALLPAHDAVLAAADLDLGHLRTAASGSGFDGLELLLMAIIYDLVCRQ